MLDFSVNQTIIMGLVLLLGCALGLMMRSGAKKWRLAYQRERDWRIAAESARDRNDARVTELEAENARLVDIEKERDTHVAHVQTANNRIAELEKDRPFINADTAGSIAAAASGHRDDLARIFGVGRSGETRLNDLGIHSYADIIKLKSADEAALEARLGAVPGTIAEERWREQADLLKHGKYEEHARLFA
jgi:predicted flap endonuclease-1-like 5' DNA nuclease